MSKLETAVGAFFTNNHRYIKIDGSGFHSGKLKSTFEKAAFNTGALCVLAMFGFDYLNQINLNSLDSSTLYNLGKNTLTFLGIAGSHNILDTLLRDKKPNPLRNKPIDTEGRDLSRSDMTLDELNGLKESKNKILNDLPIEFAFNYFALSYIYGMNGFLMHSAMYTAARLSGQYRLNKIIIGHDPDIEDQGNGYVFCDEPPAKTVKAKSKSLSFGGLRSPL